MERKILKRVFADCPANDKMRERRGFVVYQLMAGKVVVGCKGAENGGCGRVCFLEGNMWGLDQAHEEALIDAGIKKKIA